MILKCSPVKASHFQLYVFILGLKMILFVPLLILNVASVPPLSEAI